jgi:hypothetical protein
MKFHTQLILAAALLTSFSYTSPAREPSVSATPGSSYATAIRVPATNEHAGIRWERSYLASHYRGARFAGQRLGNHAGRVYDIMTIVTPDGKQQSVYFDISRYFGRF